MDSFEVIRTQASQLHNQAVSNGADYLNPLGLVLSVLSFLKIRIYWLDAGSSLLKGSYAFFDEQSNSMVLFKIGKEKRGAIVIQPEGEKDIFDLPPHKLKKLVQGFLWRDEHFAGMALTEIARREKCSEAYVGTAIFKTFEIPRSA